MKLLTFQKKNLGPVHLLPKTDKWDYLRSPTIEKMFVSCFDIGEVPRRPGKRNWNLLSFLPFIFTFEQSVTITILYLFHCTTIINTKAQYFYSFKALYNFVQGFSNVLFYNTV